MACAELSSCVSNDGLSRQRVMNKENESIDVDSPVLSSYFSKAQRNLVWYNVVFFFFLVFFSMSFPLIPTLFCPICHEHTLQAPVIVTPCHHTMCGSCFMEWARHWQIQQRQALNDLLCPLCRQKILVFGIVRPIAIDYSKSKRDPLQFFDLVVFFFMIATGYSVIRLLLRSYVCSSI